MKVFILIVLASLVSLTAFTKERYCKDQGYAEIEINNDKITIMPRGIGEVDLAMNFEGAKPHVLTSEEAANLSENLGLELESGTVYQAVLVEENFKVKATILTVKTKVDLRGKVNGALLVSLAGSDSPSMLGFDTLCK